MQVSEKGAEGERQEVCSLEGEAAAPEERGQGAAK